MKKYKQKDLGYPREKTDAQFIVQMPDYSYWGVPCQIIVDSRDEYYKKDKEDTVKYIRRNTLSEYEISEWASNNMDWKDVKEYAVFIKKDEEEFDFQEGWTNGDNEIKGKI